MFGGVEAPLGPVAVLLDVGIVGDTDRAGALRRDHRLGLHAGDFVAQIVAVTGLVGKHRVGVMSVEKVGGGRDVVGLPRRDAKPLDHKPVAREIDAGVALVDKANIGSTEAKNVPY